MHRLLVLQLFSLKMDTVWGFTVTVLWGCLFQHVAAESRTNFKVKRFAVPYVDPIVKFFANVTDENDKQYCNYDVSMPIPADEHIGVIVDIKSMLTNKTVVPLFNFHEKYLCKSANKFLGEFWYDLVRASQFPPGVCPIPAGRYHGHHVHLKFRSISLQTFPFGKLRFTMKVNDDRRPKSKNILIVILVEVENMPN